MFHMFRWEIKKELLYLFNFLLNKDIFIKSYLIVPSGDAFIMIIFILQKNK